MWVTKNIPIRSLERERERDKEREREREREKKNRRTKQEFITPSEISGHKKYIKDKKRKNWLTVWSI